MKKKATTKKSAAKKSGGKKTIAKKTVGKKTSAKKTVPKKSTVKKAIVTRAGPTRSTLTFLTESLPAFRVGQIKKTRVQAVGGTLPYSFGITQGTLPPGLGFNHLGTLFGRPTQSGDTTIFVKVIDFVGAHLTQAFDLQVMDA
jgi:hypothetical protein